MATVDIRQGYKDSTWFTANASLVLKEGQVVHLLQTGTYKIGDGVTVLSALAFLGGGGSGLFEERIASVSSTTTYTLQAPGKTTDLISQVFLEGQLLMEGEDFTITTSTTLTFPSTINSNRLQIFYGTSGVYDNGGIIPPAPPNIYSNINSLAAFSYTEGYGPSSASISFPIYGQGLSVNGTLTVPTNFEASANNGSTWSDGPLTIDQIGGIILTASIYKVRLKAGLSIASYSGNVVLSSSGATNFNIAVSGSVTAASTVIEFSTDGAVTQDGDYKIVQLSDAVNPQQIFFSNVPVGETIDVEIYAGGAGGGAGRGNGAAAGGGGAGQKKSFTFTPLLMPYASFSGLGGIGGLHMPPDPPENGSIGGDSYFNGYTAKGGGFGSASASGTNDGGPGGNGGGAGSSNLNSTGGIGLDFNGGNNKSNDAPYMGGGGGSATENGYNGDHATKKGYGGDGFLSLITGIKYSGGGGGAGCAFGTPTNALGGDAGTSGGNGGTVSVPTGLDAVTYGSGGGAGWSPASGQAGNGGAGKQGVVLIKIYSPA